LVAACLLAGGGSRPAPCVTALPPLCALALRGGSSPPGAAALFDELPPRYNYSTAGDAPAPPTSRSWRALIEGPPAKKRHFVSVAQVWDPASPCASHALACTSITHPPCAFTYNMRAVVARGAGFRVWAEQPTPYTLHPTPYTLHPAPCTLHPKRLTYNTRTMSHAPDHTHPQPRARTRLRVSRGWTRGCSGRKGLD
jgi:hypothetical protein